MEEKKTTLEPELTKVFTELVEDHVAGKPQDDSVRWIGLKNREIQEKLAERDYQVSPYILGELIKNAGLKKRSYLKSLCAKEVDRASFYLSRGLAKGLYGLDVEKQEAMHHLQRALSGHCAIKLLSADEEAEAKSLLEWLKNESNEN